MSVQRKLVSALLVAIGLAALNVAFLAMFWTTTQPTARSEDTRSGAGNVGAVIDASKYSNLQSAIDAVPARGVNVQLPPKTQDVSEPQ